MAKIDMDTTGSATPEPAIDPESARALYDIVRPCS